LSGLSGLKSLEAIKNPEFFILEKFGMTNEPGKQGTL